MSSNTHRRHPKEVDNTGFSGNSSTGAQRILNRDGSANLRKTGIAFFRRFSIYHSLLKMSRLRFLFMVFLFYTVTNLFFATVYLSIGLDKLSGAEVSDNFLSNFSQAFFFSSQTMTTVGYGHVAPSGFIANAIASVESFLGIMTFAIVTGMFYARFSRPQAFIQFSDNFLVSPYKNGKAIMFRLATYKNNELTDVEAKITLAMHVLIDGVRTAKFFPLNLEISKIGSLPISWTCVHHLNEDSPLYNLQEEDLRERSMEMLVTIKAFDDHFSNTVQQKTSYSYREMVYGAKFIPMYERTEGSFTEVKLDMINAFDQHVFEEKAVEA
ncbi:MAG: Inward rectifier potassium channel Irk [Sphingobacteriales bacterium]|nr:MAG: Inward rectifier potassium channel Irk [Sphingobacteriales bacterium]